MIDIGCGEGCWTIVWVENGYVVTGLDIAPSAIAKAKESAARNKAQAAFVVDDILNFSDISTQSYDMVFESQCFQQWKIVREHQRMPILSPAPSSPRYNREVWYGYVRGLWITSGILWIGAPLFATSLSITSLCISAYAIKKPQCP